MTELHAAAEALHQTASDLGRRAAALRAPAAPPRDGDLTRLLTPRQIEILALVAEGLSNAEIASRLYLTESTVKWHIRKILRALASRTGRRRWRSTCRLLDDDYGLDCTVAASSYWWTKVMGRGGSITDGPNQPGSAEFGGVGGQARPGSDQVVRRNVLPGVGLACYTFGMTHKVGIKGQVVIPKAIRDEIGIQPGDEVAFEPDGSEVRVRRVEDDPAQLASDVKSLRGLWTDTPGGGPDELLKERRRET